MHAQVASEDSELLGGIPAARLTLIERIARAAGTGGARRELTQRFLRGYFRGVAEEDLAARTPGHLAGAALAHLAFGTRRVPGRALVRVFNPEMAREHFTSPHTLVLTVTDDMPFLVDSLSMAFGRAQLAVHLIVHPVLQVRRDARGRLLAIGANGAQATQPESWQLYEIDRLIDPQQIERLQRDLESTLADVRSAVTDWMPMREKMREIIANLESDPPPLPAAEVSETRHLLEWMEARHFVFLGYRHYRLERGGTEDRLVPDVRSAWACSARPGASGSPPRPRCCAARCAAARAPELLIVTKANSTATVHRGEHLDYVGIKTFDTRGKVDGEHRFVGLWTSTAYFGSPREMPVLRRKVEAVIEHFGLDPAGHDGKAVLNVLETYPRDELFQAGVAELVPIVRGVVNLYERRTVRLLVRRDPYHRFCSCLVYVPRDRYNTEVRQRIEQIALAGFAGTSVESHAQISGSSHARVHVVVHTDPGRQHKADLRGLERRIAEAALTWNDRLREVLTRERGEAVALALAGRYRQALPLAYQDDVAPADALGDLAELEALREQPQALRLCLHRPVGQKLERVHLKIVKLGDPVPISDILPMLENFGLRVISERPYELAWPEGGAAWIQDFELEHRERLGIDIPQIDANFREAFGATWSGRVENDGFNRLLLGAALSVRQIMVLRAYCRYLLQTGMPFSQAYMERTLAANPDIARALARLFETRFDTAAARKGSGERQTDKLIEQIRAALDGVASLDDDRILRAYLHLVRATVRTNFYQRAADGEPKNYLSFKFDPAMVPDLPLPRPKFEIFVYSPRVEGVHLRRGPIARGGIRWSDRREDFRTEVLGLMKAQNVKNTVIMPVGAKGGFVARRLPAGTREEVQRRGDRVLPAASSADCSISPTTSSAGASCRRRRWCAATATMPTWWSPPTRARRPSRTSPTRSRPSTASGSGMRSPPAAPPATTTRRWASLRAVPGSASSATSASSGDRYQQQDRLHRRRDRRHVGRCLRQRHAAVAPHPAGGRVQSPPHLPRSGARYRGELRRARAAVLRCRARAGTTTSAACSRAAAACSRAPPRPSHSRPRCAPCSAWTAPAPLPTRSSARSCACRSTCYGMAASAPT